MNDKAAQRICAIIVTFNPNGEVLARLVSTITQQVEHLLIIDNNSSSEKSLPQPHPSLEVIRLDDNHGIARAQNEGIERARSMGCNYVLLLDQDSNPAPNMVTVLFEALRRLENHGERPACVGPRYSDTAPVNVSPFVRLEGIRLKRLDCGGTDAVVKVDFLIASGCLIPMSVLDTVGPMTESLFIDYVDIEWGLRAHQLGYSSFGVCEAHMQHSVGDFSLAIGARRIPVHGPTRQYYQIRNALWLCRQNHITPQWKMALFLRIVRRLVLFSLFVSPRRENCRSMIAGLRDGYKSRMGKK
ncbi:glycosyltransferase family 2 protein [Rhizobium sp. BK399]|uniref:glycosyltransferase family 2 protein n=1 Tax=Rhizobium sp. BK399 TaxID=2587063 RepID=UPI0018314370|nr:glycosyltransferase family 2 protein [Rhizobium sp. BK399]MBB3542442.1 rhamnosyltransferase [Rhizobium sp. BK399]